MREFIQIIAGMMRKMLWFAIAVVVIIYYTIVNIFSIDTIKSYSWEQYFTDLFQFQLCDTQYRCVNYTKVFEEPVLVSEMDATKALLYLSPNTVFAATGSITPKGNNVAWISIRVYRNDEPITGYVFEPSGCLGFFGPYINSNERFVQFLGVEEDEYKNGLTKKFYNEINSKFTIYTATDNISEQKLVENDNLKCISHLIENHLPDWYDIYGEDKYFFHPDKEFYINKTSYITVRDIYEKYFSSKNYIKQLTQI